MRKSSNSVTLRNEHILKRIKDIKGEHPFWGYRRVWAYENKVVLDFSRPGRPKDNAYIESFNGSFRDECLNTHWFLSLDDARGKIETWRRDYKGSGPILRWKT